MVVAGHMTEAIHSSLKRDVELLSKTPLGQEVPPPLLYDPEVRRRHHQGQCRPLKSILLPNILTVCMLRHPNDSRCLKVSSWR